MLNAAVPKPSAASKRRVAAGAVKSRQALRKVGLGAAAALASGALPRGSCCHSAMMFSSSVTTAAPWITWMSLRCV